jgi:hypothetical protein
MSSGSQGAWSGFDRIIAEADPDTALHAWDSAHPAPTEPEE